MLVTYLISECGRTLLHYLCSRHEILKYSASRSKWLWWLRGVHPILPPIRLARNWRYWSFPHWALYGMPQCSQPPKQWLHIAVVPLSEYTPELSFLLWALHCREQVWRPSNTEAEERAFLQYKDVYIPFEFFAKTIRGERLNSASIYRPLRCFTRIYAYS